MWSTIILSLCCCLIQFISSTLRPFRGALSKCLHLLRLGWHYVMQGLLCTCSPPPGNRIIPTLREPLGSISFGLQCLAKLDCLQDLWLWVLCKRKASAMAFPLLFLFPPSLIIYWYVSIMDFHCFVHHLYAKSWHMNQNQSINVTFIITSFLNYVKMVTHSTCPRAVRCCRGSVHNIASVGSSTLN